MRPPGPRPRCSLCCPRSRRGQYPTVTASGIAAGGCAVNTASSTGGGTAGASTGPASGGVSVTTTYTLSANSPTTGWYAYGTAADKASNTASGTFGPILIDKTPPTVTYTVSGTLGNNGWYTSTLVTVTFTCYDALSGIAVSTTPGCGTSGNGSLGSCATQNPTAAQNGGVSVTNTWTVNTDTTRTVVTGTAPDRATNTAATNTTIKRDTARPTSLISEAGADGDGIG